MLLLFHRWQNGKMLIRIIRVQPYVTRGIMFLASKAVDEYGRRRCPSTPSFFFAHDRTKGSCVGSSISTRTSTFGTEAARVQTGANPRNGRFSCRPIT